MPYAGDQHYEDEPTPSEEGYGAAPPPRGAAPLGAIAEKLGEAAEKASRACYLVKGGPGEETQAELLLCDVIATLDRSVALLHPDAPQVNKDHAAAAFGLGPQVPEAVRPISKDVQQPVRDVTGEGER